MDLVDFEFTKRKVVKRIYSLYLNGKSTQEIRIITRYDDKTINNVIDCCNYLYV